MLYTPRCQCDLGGGFKGFFTLSILNLSFGKWCIFANIVQKGWNHHFVTPGSVSIFFSHRFCEAKREEETSDGTSVGEADIWWDESGMRISVIKATIWIYPSSSNSGKWKFRLGSPDLQEM